MFDSRARDAGRRCVGRGDGLGACGLERGAERERPQLLGGNGVVRREDRLAVAAGEMHRAGVAGRDIAERVIGGDGERLRRAGGVGSRKAGDFQRAGSGRLDDDVLFGADDGGVRGIGRRDRLGAGGLERHGERMRAGVCRGEGDSWPAARPAGRCSRTGSCPGRMCRCRHSG